MVGPPGPRRWPTSRASRPPSPPRRTLTTSWRSPGCTGPLLTCRAAHGAGVEPPAGCCRHGCSTPTTSTVTCRCARTAGSAVTGRGSKRRKPPGSGGWPAPLTCGSTTSQPRLTNGWPPWGRDDRLGLGQHLRLAEAASPDPRPRPELQDPATGLHGPEHTGPPRRWDPQLGFDLRPLVAGGRLSILQPQSWGAKFRPAVHFADEVVTLTSKFDLRFQLRVLTPEVGK
jgi:hypothetical protein